MSDVDAPVEAPRKRSATVLVPALLVLLVVTFVVIVLATRDPAANRVVQSPLIGRPAPAITGETLTGESFTLDDELGKFTLVNFFASWCVPCVQEHDDLAAFDRRHRRIGDAGVVSVVFDDSPDNARAFFAERGGDWPVVVGDEGDISNDYGVAAVPESYLLGPDGTVLAKIVGGVTEEGLDELLARMTGGAPS